MSQLSILIKPASSACNMRCAYCFYRDVADNRDRFSYGIMSSETTEDLMKNVFTYAMARFDPAAAYQDMLLLTTLCNGFTLFVLLAYYFSK